MRQISGVLIAATAVLLLLSACGGGSVKPEARRPAPVAPGDDAPRSKYGNPEYYEVYGERYHVLPSARGYNERGMASWYGEDFHGKRTSSGEPYNMHAMTAAHKTLPLPTYVRVTNLQNKREVILRVNDRGPFHDDRIIDLSFAAATELGLVRNGIAEVEVTAVDPVTAAVDAEPRRSSGPPPVTVRTEPVVKSAPPVKIRVDDETANDVLAPDEIPVGGAAGNTGPMIKELPPDETTLAKSSGQSTKPVQSQNPTPMPGHYLQVGAYSESKNADVMVGRLRKAGFDAVGIYPTRGILKVRLGPYANRAAAQDDHSRLAELGIRVFLVEE